MGRNDLVCRCGEVYEAYECDLKRCKGRAMLRCRECHNELVHGVLGPPMQSRPWGGGAASEGDSPWEQIAVRELENVDDPR